MNRWFICAGLTACLGGIAAVQASTVAHWNFSGPTPTNGAYMAGNGTRADLDGDGAMDSDDFRISALDLSGNGNHLTAWTSSWMKWSSDSVMGDFSMQYANSWPAASTDSAYNPHITGTDVESITPAHWTVEALFKSETLKGNQTLVGRDGWHVGGSSGNAAAFYLSTRGTDLAVEYTDTEGAKHSLQVAAKLKPGIWYTVAAVSDGSTLGLYLCGTLVGTLDLTTTGTDSALGLGSGIWSVARGMWADEHVDRFFGMIDEVAISDAALAPSAFVIPRPGIGPDSDHDGMGDLYEQFFGLDAGNSADALENGDADTLVNFTESIFNTDPHVADTDSDGLNDDVDDDPVSRAVMMWGHPGFTHGDTYDYTGPAWWLGAGKIGGAWVNNNSWVVPAEERGMLYIDINRSMVSNNLVLNLLHQNVAECLVYLDLGNTNGTVLFSNLYGDIADGDGSQDLGRYMLPLESYPEASRIIIDATAGAEPYTVWAATLYEDADADGLDAAQEIQFGTSDADADSDGDGLIDYAEVMVYGTNPSDADSDRDGYPDGEELLVIGSSPTVPMWQEGGMPGILQVERWNGIDGARISALTGRWGFGGRAGSCSLVDATEYAPVDLNDGDDYGIRMRGSITPPLSGTYEFRLTGDDSAQVWFSDNASPYDRRLLLDLKAWTGFEDLANERSPSATVELTSDQPYYFEILLKERGGHEHVSLWWTPPGAAEPEIIGSQYLHSYVQPGDDGDADGLPDGWERETGLDPLSGMGGGLRDADGDGYSDLIEYTLGLNPMDADEDDDGLSGGDETTVTKTDPLNADTDGDGIADLRTAFSIRGAEFLERYDSHHTAVWTSDGTNAVLSTPNLDPWIIYPMNITNAGMYRLAVDASCLKDYRNVAHEISLDVRIDGCSAGRLWMNHSSKLPMFTGFTPWLTEGYHEIKLVVHTDFWTFFDNNFSIHSVSLGAVDGADADGNGMQDWMESILAKGGDTDGDGISDLDEILVYGTGVTDADSDNDGLDDGEELVYGADPLNADTDGDGVSDGVEAKEILTDVLSAEFDGSSETVLTVSGAQTNGCAGSWLTEGSEILSTERRGYVEYVLDFPEQDLYCLNITAAHQWQRSGCSPVEPIDTSSFLVYVDGTFVGEYSFVCADGVYENARAFLPVLPAGEHTVRIFWENVHTRLSIKIRQLELQSLGGPDENGNGVKDWIEASLSVMAGVDETATSCFSPACIEGDARYVPMMSLVSQSSVSTMQSEIPRQSAGARWYANLPLETNGTTRATASFQNGALEVPLEICWVPYNLADHDGETLRVRKGDSVKFTILPEGARGGQFEIDAGNGPVRSPNTHALVFNFSEAGTFSVNGTYTHGHETVAASITVVVLEGTFPDVSPACLTDKERTWSFSGMPSNVVYETDDSVGMAVVSYVADVTKLSLTTSEANKTHALVARTCPGGPILASTTLDTCWIQNAADGYFWTVDVYEDSELWEVESIERNLPDTVDLKIKVIVGGVVFDDYTLERWVTKADYDGTGVYRFRLIHPNDQPTSACHSFMAYQDGELIGEVLTGDGE